MTEISAFYRSLRVVLGDLDGSVRRYPDSVLGDGIKTVVQLGKVYPPGWPVETVAYYNLTPDETGIDPEVMGPNAFALFVYHAGRLFANPSPDRYAFKTRAFSESFGSVSRFLDSLEVEIHRLENGDCFASWQSYFSWLSGMAGLPLAEVLTDMSVEAPLWHATLQREGIRTVPSGK